MKKKDLMFLCGAKDFHAMDKFKLVFDILGAARVILVTDTIQGEGQVSLIQENYPVEKLFIIDQFTLDYQSRWSHLWRNIIKLVLLPAQARRLRKLHNDYQPYVVHAAPIYYMFLCRLAGIKYIGTPQAGEILERPSRSLLYKIFAGKALEGASQVIVDSLIMKETLKKSFKIESVVIKNGFDASFALDFSQNHTKRARVVSFRGLQDNYQIFEIFKARNRFNYKIPIDLIYPFYDIDYLKSLKDMLQPTDQLYGLLEKKYLYQMLGECALGISIPTSDSSPRSVYEAIFCGAAMAITPTGYYDELPMCMKARIYLVDLSNKMWFSEALEFARRIVKSRYVPSKAAIRMCDQRFLINTVIDDVYKLSSK